MANAKWFLATALGASILDVGAAMAQAAPNATPTVDTVIVTAAKRSENIQHVPISITALSEGMIRETGATRVEDLVRAVPGLSYNENGSNSAAYTIRGVNSSSSVGNVQAPVAIYIDEAPALDPFIPATITDLRLFDVRQVEVLRGPQGTLFGSGALGGAIRIITNKPDTSKYDAEIESTASTIDRGGGSLALNGMANLPLVPDRLALRVVAYYDSQGGWIDNTTRHDSDVNRAITEGGRAELRWTPTANLTLTGTFLAQDDRPHDSADTSYTNQDFQYGGLVPQFSAQNLKTYNLVGEYALPWATITSSTSYLDKASDVQADFSARTHAITGVAAPAPINDIGSSGTFIQEVRVASAQAHPFKWLGGLYYEDYSRNYSEALTQAGAGAVFAPFGFPSDTLLSSLYHLKVREEAVFGEVSYDILDNLTATAGVRAFHDTVSAFTSSTGILGGGAPLTNGSSYTRATPKFVLTYAVSPRAMVYVQASEGYRVGQANLSPPKDPVSGQLIPGSYGPDQLWNYEAGFKTKLFDSRLTADGAAYYIDWKNIQLQQSTVPSGFVFTNNAGDAVIKGVEIELNAHPTEPLSLGVSLSYDQGRLTRVNPGVVATVGDQLPGSAPFTGYAYAKYDFPLGAKAKGYVRADYKYVSKEYADLHNATSLQYGDYGSVNAEAGLSVGRTEVMLFVNNLTNGAAIVNARELFAVPTAFRQQPRTVGITLRAHL